MFVKDANSMMSGSVPKPRKRGKDSAAFISVDARGTDFFAIFAQDSFFTPLHPFFVTMFEITPFRAYIDRLFISKKGVMRYGIRFFKNRKEVARLLGTE